MVRLRGLAQLHCRTTVSGVVTIVCLIGVPAYAQAPTATAFARAYQTGTPLTATGIVTAVYKDDFAHRRSELVHVLRDARTGRTFTLRFDRVPTGLSTGAVFKVNGRAHGSELYVLADQTSPNATSPSGTTTQSAATPTGTDQPTLVLITNFADASVTCPTADIDDMMFTDPSGLSVAALYRESSLGTVSLSGTVAGPFAVPFTASDACDIGAWADAADVQAAAAGLNPSGYAHKVYVMPPNSCQAAGYGTVGGTPSGAWIFTCDLRGVFAHELGHNLGMDHASTPDAEYGDSTDPMAYGSTRLRGVNAPHRQELGWLGTQSVQRVDQSGTYIVSALVLDPSAATSPQTLEILKPDTGDYYYLSYRVANGFDDYIDETYIDKVSVHRYLGDGSSSHTYLLAGLGDGMSFTDTTNGITVTEVAHGLTDATVQVQFQTPCVTTTPLLTVSPPSQSATAGAALTYTVSVTSRDTVQCGSDNFDLSAAVPSGWTGTWSTAGLSLASGATGQTQLTLTSPATAPAGTYAAAVAVGTSDTTLHSASGAASYAVLPPCVASTPALAASPVSQSGPAGSTLSYVLSVTNRDSDSCPASTFGVQAQPPSSWPVALTAPALTLAPGQTGTATLSVTSAASAASGSYQVRTAVSDAMSSAHATSTAVTDIILTPVDVLPPTPPAALTATLQSKQKVVQLAWQAASDNVGVVGYRVVRNGATVATASAPGWTDTAYIAGATYNYTVVAFDAAGNLSAASNGVSVLIPGGGGKKR